MLHFKHQFTETGYCQACFILEVTGHKLFYCLQDEGAIIEMYRCSSDWEPQYQVTIKSDRQLVFDDFEALDDYTKNMITQWKKTHAR